MPYTTDSAFRDEPVTKPYFVTKLNGGMESESPSQPSKLAISQGKAVVQCACAGQLTGLTGPRAIGELLVLK